MSLGDPRENRHVDGLAGPDRKPLRELAGQRARDDQPGREGEGRDRPGGPGPHPAPSSRSTRSRSNQTPTAPRYAHGNSSTAGRVTVKATASSTYRPASGTSAPVSSRPASSPPRDASSTPHRANAPGHGPIQLQPYPEPVAARRIATERAAPDRVADGAPGCRVAGHAAGGVRVQPLLQLVAEALDLEERARIRLGRERRGDRVDRGPALPVPAGAVLDLAWAPSARTRSATSTNAPSAR